MKCFYKTYLVYLGLLMLYNPGPLGLQEMASWSMSPSSLTIGDLAGGCFKTKKLPFI